MKPIWRYLIILSVALGLGLLVAYVYFASPFVESDEYQVVVVDSGGAEMEATLYRSIFIPERHYIHIPGADHWHDKWFGVSHRFETVATGYPRKSIFGYWCVNRDATMGIRLGDLKLEEKTGFTYTEDTITFFTPRLNATLKKK